MCEEVKRKKGLEMLQGILTEVAASQLMILGFRDGWSHTLQLFIFLLLSLPSHLLSTFEVLDAFTNLSALNTLTHSILTLSM